MAKIGTGAISITDVKDGIQPIVMQLSNEAHAFVADQNGNISAEELASFVCDVTLWIGDVEATYTESVVIDATTAKANKNTYNIKITDTNAAWANQKAVYYPGAGKPKKCRITTKTIPGGTLPASKSNGVTVEVTASNSIGRLVTGQLTISQFKGIQGVDGVAIRLEPSRLYFMADGDNKLIEGQGNIVIKPKVIGNIGTVMNVKLSKDGGVWYDYNGQAIGPNGVTDTNSDGFKDYTPTDANKDGFYDWDIVITPEMFGTCDILTVFVKGSANEHASDTLSIARVKKGSAGEAALSVFVNSDANGTIFKNGALDTHRKKLTAEIYDMGTGTEIINGQDGYNVVYTWMKDNAPCYVDAGNNVVLAGDAGAVPATGSKYSYIIIGSEDVDDGKSAQFTVNVNVDKV